MNRGQHAKRDHRPEGSVELQALLLSSLYKAQTLAAFAAHNGYEPTFHESFQNVGNAAVHFQGITVTKRRH